MEASSLEPGAFYWGLQWSVDKSWRNERTNVFARGNFKTREHSGWVMAIARGPYQGLSERQKQMGPNDICKYSLVRERQWTIPPLQAD